MQQIWKACIAGLAGGLLGSLVMGKVHSAVGQLVSAPPPQGEDSTVKTASALSRAVLHRDLTREEKQKASPIVHYAFGGSIGAAYGAIAEFVPILRAGSGVLFGSAVWLGAHVIAVPALGLSKPVTRLSPRQEAAEFAAHIAYESVVELVRTGARAVWPNSTR